MMSAGATPLLQYWVAARPMTGQCVSGDQFLVTAFSDGTLIAVVDGLGHGDEAAFAAKTALVTLSAHASEHVAKLMQRCHEALKKTRGAVMSIASFNGVDKTMTWVGMGNVEGILVPAEAREERKRANLLSRWGIVGDRLPTLSPVTLSLHQGDLLFFATDGINSAFMRDICYTEQPAELVHRLFFLHGRNTDDALLLGARWKHDDTTLARMKG